MTVALETIVRLTNAKVPELLMEAPLLKVIVPELGERSPEPPIERAPEILKLDEVVTVAFMVRPEKVRVPEFDIEPPVMVIVPELGVKVPVTVSAPPTVAVPTPVLMLPLTLSGP